MTQIRSLSRPVGRLSAFRPAVSSLPTYFVADEAANPILAQMRLALLLFFIGLTLGSCSFSREIRVVWRGGQLAIDFPVSFWRVVGLQHREYPCVDGLELFDAKRLIWTLDSAKPEGDCADAIMPMFIGQPKAGFITNRRIRLQPGRYGVSILSYAPARVDFILHPDGKLQNITNRDELMEAPCGTYEGPMQCPLVHKAVTK